MAPRSAEARAQQHAHEDDEQHNLRGLSSRTRLGRTEIIERDKYAHTMRSDAILLFLCTKRLTHTGHFSSQDECSATAIGGRDGRAQVRLCSSGHNDLRPTCVN